MAHDITWERAECLAHLCVATNRNYHLIAPRDDDPLTPPPNPSGRWLAIIPDEWAGAEGPSGFDAEDILQAATLVVIYSGQAEKFVFRTMQARLADNGECPRIVIVETVENQRGAWRALVPENVEVFEIFGPATAGGAHGVH